MSGYDGSVKIKILADDTEAQQLLKTIEELNKKLAESRKPNPTPGPKPFQPETNGVKQFTIAILAAKVAMKGLNMVQDSIGQAISRFDTMSRYPRVMEQLGNSSDASNRSVRKLAKGIEGLPTRLDEVVSTAQGLASITGDLGEATNLTLALNNAFLASGASSADASRGLIQYKQMLSAGKVDMQSWKTLQETMPTSLIKVANAFGFAGMSATKDFYDALKGGQITMNDFTQKLIELDKGSDTFVGFAAMAKEGSKGIATSWQNVRTAVVNGSAEIITAINDVAKESTGEDIATNLDNTKIFIRNAFKAIANSIRTVSPVIILVVKAFNGLLVVIKYLSPAIIGLGTAFLVFNSISKITIGITLLKGVLETLYLKALYAGDAIKVLGATIMAHPIVAGIAVVTGIVAGLAFAFNKISPSAQEAIDSMKEAASESQELADSVQDGATAWNKQKELLQINADSMRELADKTANLSKKQGRTAVETKELKENIAELNKYIGEEVIQYNENAKAINLSSEAMKAYIDQGQAQKKLEAVREKMTQLDKDQIDLSVKKKANAELLKKAEDELNNTYWFNFKQKGELKTRIEELTKVQESLTEAEKVNAEQVTVAQQMKQDALSQAAVAEQELKKAQQERVVAFEELDDKEKKLVEDMRERYKAIVEASTSMFDRLNTESKLSAQEMYDNLEFNILAVENWAANLKELAEKGLDEGLLEQLRKLGPSGAGEVAELNRLTSEQLSSFNELMGKAGETGIDAFLKSMNLNPEEVPPEILGFATDIGNTLTQAIKNQDWPSLAKEIGNGAIEGIKQSEPEVQTATNSLAGFAKSGFAEALGIHSPSKAFEGFGVNMGEGLISGIRSISSRALSGLKSLLDDIKSIGSLGAKEASIRTAEGFESGRATAYINGQNLGEGFNLGLLSTRSLIVSTAIEIANSARYAMQKTLDIHSPSKVTAELGTYTGEGFEIGLKDKLGAIKSVSKQLAESAIPKVNTDRLFNFKYLSEDRKVTNNPVTNNNSSINIEKVEWRGKEDIMKTMEEMGWIVGKQDWRLQPI